MGEISEKKISVLLIPWIYEWFLSIKEKSKNNISKKGRLTQKVSLPFTILQY